jgi:hypothetical protein
LVKALRKKKTRENDKLVTKKRKSKNKSRNKRVNIKVRDSEGEIETEINIREDTRNVRGKKMPTGEVT